MERVRKSYSASEGGCSYKNECNEESHPCKNIVNKDEIHEITAIVIVQSLEKSASAQVPL